MQPGLYIVATPIGNLADITYRAVEVLKAATMVLAEDTRHSRKLLSHYEIDTRLVSNHKFNEASRVERTLAQIHEGAAVAMISDAGMPCISDPGSRLVTACHEAGLHVEVLPGPSAVVSAVAMSGMGENGFHFEGFLPPKSGARLRKLEALSTSDVAVVFYESPYRVLKLLNELHQVMPDRNVFVTREMTKKFEQSYLGKPAELLEAWGTRTPKGEFVFVIDAASKKERKKD